NLALPQLKTPLKYFLHSSVPQLQKSLPTFNQPQLGQAAKPLALSSPQTPKAFNFPPPQVKKPTLTFGPSSGPQLQQSLPTFKQPQLGQAPKPLAFPSPQPPKAFNLPP